MAVDWWICLLFWPVESEDNEQTVWRAKTQTDSPDPTGAKSAALLFYGRALFSVQSMARNT